MEQDEPRIEFEPEMDSEQDFEFDDISDTEERTLKVRLDKWLWAARFFKTRALARAAVENGKVYYNGERSKPSREIEIDAILQIRHGRYEKTVIVKGLSTRRRSTEEALQLFEETEESRIARENIAEYSAVPIGQPMPYGGHHHHAPRFQEAQHYSAFPSAEAPKRRAVRFLRRSFVREGQPSDVQVNPSSHQGYGHVPTQSSPTFPQQNHFNPHRAYSGSRPMRHENRGSSHYGYPEQRSRQQENTAGYDNRRPGSDYRSENYGNSHQHSGAPHSPYRQQSNYPAHSQNMNGYPGHHHSRHSNNQNFNYYGPQSYKEANGNIGHLPLREKETEIEESSD